MSSNLKGTREELRVRDPLIELSAVHGNNDRPGGEVVKTYDLSSYSRSVNFCEVSNSKMMYLNLTINNGVEVQGLVDTGAQRTLVHASVVAQCNLNNFICKSDIYRLKAIGEEKGTIASGTVLLNMSVRDIIMEPISCLVVPDSIAMSNKVILGIDFLKLNKLTVNSSKRILSQHLPNGSHYDIYLSDRGNYERTMFRGVRCVAVEPLTLQPHESKLINVESSFSLLNDYFNEGKDLLYCDNLNGKERFTVTNGLVNSDSMNMMVSETKGKSLHIRVGDIIGVVSSVEVLDCDETVDKDWDLTRIKQEITLPELTCSQHERVWEMVLRTNACLGKDNQDVGMAAVTAHTIRLHDETPIYQRPRRFPEPVTEEIERQCEELYDMDIIEPSTSAFASPVVPIRKADGSIRLCVDYRKLNKVTKPDRSPIPNLTDSVYGLHGNRYFTSLDLVKGFYHIPIDEESREYTAFITARSHWQFKRLSFGLRNAPVTFQREIQAILNEFPWKKVIVYIDDILIMEESFEAHLQLVGKVLATLGKYNLKIRPDKCQWFATTVDFLGHTISREGLRKQQEFVEKVEKFPRPETVSQLREFLGLVNFQRKFVKNASSVQKPLSELTGGKKRTQIVWTPERIEAFNTLKEQMKEDVLLSYPCYAEDAEPMQLWVDVSSVGAGACLKQKQQGEDRVIAYASMTFSASQRNYSTIDRELAALRWGVKTFHSFLYAVPFVLKTDHQPLVYLHNMRLVDSRLARTLEDLGEFHFSIEYAPGTSNVAADALSRMRGIPQPEDCSEGPTVPAGMRVDGDVVPGGGDSLFISLQRVLESSDVAAVPSSSLVLREQLLDELLKSPEKYGLPSKGHTRRDLRLMRHPHQLPCLEVLLAASYLYKATIFVYFWTKEPVVYYDGRTNRSTNVEVYLQCLGGIHFNPLKCAKEHEIEVANLKSVTVPSPDVSMGGAAEGREVDNCLLCEPSNHPRISVSCGDLDLCAIIDTGAEVSLIRDSICQLEGVRVNHRQGLTIEGFSGIGHAMNGQVTFKLELPNGMISEEHTFVVVPDHIIPNCCLLGIDFLAKANLSLDVEAGRCIQQGTFKGVAPLLPGRLSNKLVNLAQNMNTSGGEEDTLANVNELVTSFLERDAILKTQNFNPYISEVVSLLEENVPSIEWPDYLGQYRSAYGKLRVQDKILMYCKGSQFLVVVSLDLLVDIAIAAHYRMMHIGRDKLIHLLRCHLWHPKIYSVCRDICTTCSQCQLMKVARQVQVPPTIKINTSHPFELMAIDLVVFPKIKDGWIGCVVLIDHNSKWLVAVPIKNKSTLTVCTVLEHQIFPFLPKLPERLLSDNGLEFASVDFNKLLTKFSIKHIFTTSYKPSSNGCVERANRTLELLRSAAILDGDWRQNLTKAIIVYNNTRHRELNQSPSEYLLMRGHVVRDLILVTESDTRFWKAGHPKFIPFSVGQHVLRKLPRQGHAASSKFKPRYDGPFEVTLVNDNGVTYELVRVGSADRIRAHHSQLIPWTAPPDYLRTRLLEFEAAGDDSEEVEQSGRDSSSDFSGFPSVYHYRDVRWCRISYRLFTA